MIQNGAMTGTTKLSDIIHLGDLRGYCFHLEWTGTPAGGFKVQQCGKFPTWTQGKDLPAFAETDWVDISGATKDPAGAAGVHVFEGQTSAPWVRMLYTNASSTGVLQSFSSEK